MKKRRLAAFFLAAAMSLQGIAGSVPVSAAEALGEDLQAETNAVLPGVSKVIYEKNDFSQTNDLQYLEGNGGNGGNRQPTYSGDTMSFNGGSAHKVIVTADAAQNLTDFVYEADLSVTAKGSDNFTSQAGLLFRVTEAKPNMSDGYKGYYFGIDPQAQQVILGKANDGKWTEIATKKMSLEFGKLYHATDAVSDNLITAYIDYDGEHYAKITAVDDEFASGGIGTRHWISSAAWKNLKVSAYSPEAISPEDAYTNPLLNMCADPDVLYHNGTYFLYPTNAGDANDDEGIKVYTSTDLVHWTEQGFAFQKGDGWGTGNFWAPDTIERDGVFYMYYTANEQICVAESDSPLGPYKQTIMEPMHRDVKEIDAHVFYDEASGKYYMYFVRFTDGNVIYGAELNDDMKSIKEDTITELLKANQGWDQDMAKVNEGPFMLTKDGKYYLTYSGSHFQSIQYGAAYAVSDSPLGKYVKYNNNPIMKSNSLAHGTGHHCVAESPDGKEMFMVYHSHHDLNNTEPRQLCIDRMQFTTDAAGNTVLEVNGPTVSPQKLPSGSVDVDNFIEFDKGDLEAVRVEAGATKEQLKTALPSEVTVKASKSSDKKASVEWNLDTYTAENSQDVIIITGTATLPQGIANLKNSSLEVEQKVLFADLPAAPEMEIKVGDTVFGEFDPEVSEYEIKVDDMKDLPEVTVEISENDKNKFSVSVTQATERSKRAYITITSPVDSSYRKEYTIRFRAPIGLMQKIEAEDAVFTGLAKVVEAAGASGGKVIGCIDNAESTVTFEVEAPADGTYRMELGVRAGTDTWPNPSHRYWVNGKEEEARIVEYRKAAAWSFQSYMIEVDMVKGDNTFTISHVDGDRTFAELDYIVFYTAVPEMEISIGEDTLTGFDVDTASYDIDTDSLENLPEISVTFAENAKDYFKAAVTQASKKRPEAYIRVTSPLDNEYVKDYIIRFYGPDSFSNPLINYGADPYVTYQDGYYYYIRVKNDKSLWVSKSAELGRIGQVEPKKVYEPADGEPNAELWAPEMHFINGKWYIYYTAGVGSSHRMYALESNTEDAQGAYTWKGKLAPATDKWGIDQTVLEHDGQLYAVWSGWHYDRDVDQRIYIARMENPWTITGERTELSMPEYDWECVGNPIVNEGPQIAKAPDGTVNIVYSASGSWTDDYCLGSLTLKAGADPMEADSWIKSDKPIFTKNKSTTFSTGHACFTKSPDGKEDYIVYHATRGSGEGWNGRGVRVQNVYWNEDGTLDIGTALEYNGKVNMPSGTKQAEYIRYEAEKAILDGESYTMQGTYNSSGKRKVGNLSAADSATFQVTANEAGDYKLYVGAAAGKENTALSIKVNDEAAVEKEILNFNASAAGSICVDNWFGYELKVTLKKGENTIVVSGVAGKENADLDYIELCKWEDAEAPNPDVEEPEEPEDAKAPVISKEPEGKNYEAGDTAEALTVTAKAEDGGKLSYQWYQNSSNSTEGAKAIEGATKASYIPSTETVGTTYYYCAVTNTNIAATGTQTAVTNSRIVFVTVREKGTKPVDAETPVITKQPVQAAYKVNQKAEALLVTASVKDGGTLSYQWYRNSSNSIEGAAAVKGATETAGTEASYVPSIVYYYCAVTNTSEVATGMQTAGTNSNIVSVIVTEAGGDPGTDPGTKPGETPVNAVSPAITKQPVQAVYTYKQSAQPLTVTAEVSDGGTVSYQWYQNSSSSTAGAAAIQGASGSSYTPSTEAIGTVYYYCAVTNTNAAATGAKTAAVNTKVVPVTVDKAENPIVGISSCSKAVGSKLTLKPAGAATYKTSNKKVVTVTSKGNVTFKGIGKATVTVNAKGNAYYKAAVKKISFTVTPKTAQIKSAKSSKSKTISVKWKKDKAVSGYEVQYAANKNFKGAKTKKVKKNSTTSLTINKLKGGKQYYVRVRSYKKVSKKQIYSSWSKVKRVKVKK